MAENPWVLDDQPAPLNLAKPAYIIDEMPPNCTIEISIAMDGVAHSGPLDKRIWREVLKHMEPKK